MVYVIWRGKHFWRRHRTTYIKLDKKSANIQSLIHPVVLLICSYHILEKQHKKIKKSRKTGILYVKLCSGCKGLQVSNMPRPKLDSRRDSEISCKNIRQFRMQYAPGWGGSIQIVDITETSGLLAKGLLPSTWCGRLFSLCTVWSQAPSVVWGSTGYVSRDGQITQSNAF